MKKFSILIVSLVVMSSAIDVEAQKVKYPKVKRGTAVETIHGQKVEDPYRWLEDDRSKETEKWVKDQNIATQKYLSAIPYRSAIKERLTKLWNYEKVGQPILKGTKQFQFINTGLQNQSVLYQIDKDGKAIATVLDPNQLSTDGTVALGGIYFNRDGDKMAYTVNRSGSDWQEIYVLDVQTRKRTTDSIRWAKFTGVAWQGDGFYYSRYDEPTGSALSQANTLQKVYYHKLGTDQKLDVLIWQDATRPNFGWGVETTEDETMVLLYGTEGASSGNELYVRSYRSGPIANDWKKIVGGVENTFSVVTNHGENLWVMTDKGASKFKLIEININQPEEKNWKTLIAEEKDKVLKAVTDGGGRLFAHYMEDACIQVYAYNEENMSQPRVKVALPGLGTVSGFGGKADATHLYYTFTSFNYPPTVFKYEIATQKSVVYSSPKLDFDPTQFETKQVFFTSKDGTRVPIFIVHKKGLALDGQRPTYLYGYGGFNISLNPNFSVSRMILLEQGGVFAMVNLRGGGEYGEEWHAAGMNGKKQNVFDDFIGAAEYLIQSKYTDSKHLAIAGGSNGGLLVGACMTQRPDLYQVALPAVGVLDMLRFHKFTIGHAWVPEYGTADNAEDFKWLYAYSPLHNLKKGEKYPATMVTTADHDDRVVPAHSFKFISQLQYCNASKNPTLIRVETKAGHGAGKPTSKQIEEATDIWSFMLWNMGVKSLGATTSK